MEYDFRGDLWNCGSDLVAEQRVWSWDIDPVLPFGTTVFFFVCEKRQSNPNRDGQKLRSLSLKITVKCRFLRAKTVSCRFVCFFFCFLFAVFGFVFPGLLSRPVSSSLEIVSNCSFFFSSRDT